jgi:hypothetical protein
LPLFYQTIAGRFPRLAMSQRAATLARRGAAWHHRALIWRKVDASQMASTPIFSNSTGKETEHEQA